MSKFSSMAMTATAVAAVVACMGASSEARAQNSEGGSVYIGITGGYGFGNADVNGMLRRDHTDSMSEAVSEDGRSDLDGGMIGGLAGFDYSFGNGLVIGAVGDMSWMNASGNTDVEPEIINLSGSDYSVDTSLNWLGTVRGRVGFEAGNVLIYGTGGVAFGGVESDLHEDGSGSIGSDSSTQVGWTAGAGINFMATENVMLGLEYLYVDLGEQTYDFGDAGNADVDVNMSIIRGTIGYKF